MARDITVTFADGTSHVYRGAPDDVTPEQVTQRASREFGKPVKALDGGRNAQPAQGPWWGEGMRDPALAARNQSRRLVNNAAASVAEGLGQMADIPMQAGVAVQRGVNYALGKGGGAALDAIGLEGAADWWRRGSGINERSLAQTPTLEKSVQTLAPGVQNMDPATRFVGNVLGSMIVPIGPKAARAMPPRLPAPRPATQATPAAEILEAGKREGVRVMRSDINPPRTAVGRGARWLGEKIPFAGTGGMREAQQTQRLDAIKNVVSDFGGSAERTLLDDSAGAVDDVSRNLATTRGNALSRLTAQKEGVIANLSRGNEIVPVDRTVSAIDDQIAKLTRRGTPAAKTTAATLAEYRTAIQGKTLDQLEAIRKDELANAFKGGGTLADVKAVGEKSLRAIYDPLRAEMGTFIRQRGGEKALNQWSGANEKLSTLAGELKSGRFKNVLRNEELTPEAVGNLLFSKNRSDVARLVSNLDARGQAKAREAILQRAFDGSIGVDGLSAERFISNLDRLSPSITAAFKGPDLQRIQGLGRLLDATRRGAEAGRMPATGAQNTPLIVLAGMMQALGSIGTAVVGGGYGLLARAYESAPVRREMVRLASVKAGTRSETMIANRAALALTVALREQMAKAANTNVPAMVSAGETPEDQRR